MRPSLNSTADGTRPRLPSGKLSPPIMTIFCLAAKYIFIFSASEKIIQYENQNSYQLIIPDVSPSSLFCFLLQVFQLP